MKLTFILLIITFYGYAQSPVNPYKIVADQNKKLEPTFRFDALNAAIIQEDINAGRYKHKTDSARREVILRMLKVNHVDFARISEHPDSLKITPEGIFLKLKPLKK